MTTSQPGYDVPNMPTRPLLLRHVLDHPVDRVVRVGTFVDRLWIARFAQRTQHHKLSFRLEAAANVLKGKDVAVGNQLLQNPAREERDKYCRCRKACG